MSGDRTEGPRDPAVGGNGAGGEETARGGGPIEYMARNGVAANLLMVFLVAAGLISMTTIVQEVFPEFSLDAISISVVYPGATPEEVEESIVQKIEEAIESVEGIDEITATAAEGVGTVTAELELGVDVARVLDDVKSEVDQIQTFPDQVEEPDIRELTNRQSVLRIAFYGDVDERALKEWAYRVEDELSTLPSISYVETSGIRQYEVSIEVSREALRAYGLSLLDVARTVRASSLDLPAGSIEARDREVRVRTLGQNYTQQEFEDIVLVSRSDGTVLTLGDVATVRDGFEDTDLEARYNGQPAAFVEVFRTSDERVLEVTDAAYAYLEGPMEASLPAGIQWAVWEDDARILADRLGLLLKNAALGLSLVLLALTLFLNLRLAFWTAVGIGISFIGTLAVMYVLGLSINQMSLFAFILAVGIVVDDAIVVGENIFAEREKGTRPQQAAIRGARRIAVPVTFAILTTVTAFTPLLFVPGTLGKILAAIPIVVISVLVLSLVESLFILPYHLSHLPPPHQPAKNPVSRFFERIRDAVDARLRAFVDGPLDRALHFATRMPLVVVAAGIAVLLLAVALVPAGILRVQFFPPVEGDIVSATLEMPVGTPVQRTREAAERIEAAGRAARDSLSRDRDPDRPELVQAVYTLVGGQPAGGGPGGGGVTTGAHLASIQFRLLEAEQRELSSATFEQAWREQLGSVPGVRSLSFSSDLFSAGAPVSVELSHPDPETLEAASRQVMDELQRFAGVFDIQSDQDQGMEEVQLRLRPAARTLGLTLDEVARQVRAAFFGEEALRVQRGREDVRVYVRLPESQRDAVSDVEDYRIRVPGGAIPLAEVAAAGFGEAPSVIRRKEGRRVVTVTADVDPGVVTGQEVSSRLREEILPAVEADYPQLSYEFGGEQEEQQDSFGALGRGFMLALMVMYALLAVPFRSYIQPLVIMASVPFGIVGAMIGHLILGLPVGLLSLFGIIGLSGVVVNDSLVMMDFINELRLEGASMRDAIIEGAKRRFRPILLTSLTTFLGVAPLVLETSVQAQFLIPMAASLGFGILFATAILMLLVPALAWLEYEVTLWFQTRVLGRDPADVHLVHHSQHA
jgi:multidrug efflux pump subunit AcrB